MDIARADKSCKKENLEIRNAERSGCGFFDSTARLASTAIFIFLVFVSFSLVFCVVKGT